MLDISYLRKCLTARWKMEHRNFLFPSYSAFHSERKIEKSRKSIITSQSSFLSFIKIKLVAAISTATQYFLVTQNVSSLLDIDFKRKQNCSD